MALPKPDTFNIHTAKPDVIETFIRGRLNLRMENWQRLRHTIHIGISADDLHGKGHVSEEVEAVYQELPSHTTRR